MVFRGIDAKKRISSGVMDTRCCLEAMRRVYPFRVSRYSEGDFPMIFLNSREK